MQGNLIARLTGSEVKSSQRPSGFGKSENPADAQSKKRELQNKMVKDSVQSKVEDLGTH